MPLVSVIIATYNRCDLLPATIDSVFRQTVSDWEIRVGDDGSTDATADVMRRYLEDERVHYLSLPHSGACGPPRNAAIRGATGEYIAVLDHDDLWLPSKLEKQIAVMTENPDVEMVCSNAFVTNGFESHSRKPYLQMDRPLSGDVLGNLLQGNFVIGSTVVVRRSLLDRVGLYSEHPAIRGIEDYGLWLRVASATSVHFLPECLAIYRDCPSDSMRGESDFLRSYPRAMMRALEELEDYLQLSGKTDAVIRALLLAKMEGYWVDGLRQYSRSRDYRRLLTAALPMIKRHPSMVYKVPVRALVRGVKRVGSATLSMLGLFLTQPRLSDTRGLEKHRGLDRQQSRVGKAKPESNSSR